MRNSNAYAVSKLFGERLGASYAKSHQMSVLAVRIGWVWRGDNSPAGLPADRAQWFRKMWLSDRDFVHLMERCIEAPLEPGSFAIVNGMSNNARMRWDISQTRELLGYVAKDDVEG
jgi:nucleoside-diphosphate-sugar epimerase